MNDQLDFSLPKKAHSRSSGFLPKLTFLIILACLVLLIIQFTSGQKRGNTGKKTSKQAAPAEPEELKKLAEDLERRTLYGQAAEVWGEYASAADLERPEASRVLYLRAKNLKDAGRHAEAARFLTYLEQLPAEKETERRARRLLLECLSALGKEGVRENVLRAKTVSGAEETGTVLARIGGDPVTREDVEKELTLQSKNVLSMQGQVLSEQELAERAKQTAEQKIKDPEALRQALQGLISREVLCRQALAEGLADDKQYTSALNHFRKNYLAARVVNECAQEAVENITTTDLKNHYKAHKEQYVEKPRAEFSYRKFKTRKAAQSALKKLSETDFKKAPEAAVEGGPLPGLGRSAEANAHLFALQEGTCGERPIKVGESWYILRCDRKIPERQKSFEQAKAQVRSDLAALKQKEAAEKLRKKLREEYKVEILRDRLKKIASGGEKAVEPPRDESVKPQANKTK